MAGASGDLEVNGSFGLVITFVAYTRVRAGELAALRVADVRWRRGITRKRGSEIWGVGSRNVSATPPSRSPWTRTATLRVCRGCPRRCAGGTARRRGEGEEASSSSASCPLSTPQTQHFGYRRRTPGASQAFVGLIVVPPRPGSASDGETGFTNTTASTGGVAGFDGAFVDCGAGLDDEDATCSEAPQPATNTTTRTHDHRRIALSVRTVRFPAPDHSHQIGSRLGLARSEGGLSAWGRGRAASE